MENYALLVAAVVAVVAVVGMSMASQPQGAVLVDTCPEGFRLQKAQGTPGQGLLECVPNVPLPENRFPSWAEGDARRLAQAQALGK